MAEKQIGPELRLKIIDETINYFAKEAKPNKFMNRKYK